MAKIAVDLDDTLYDFGTAARDAFLVLAEKYDDKRLFMGAYVPTNEWRSFADVLGLDLWLEAIALVHDSESILRQRPFSGAADTCVALLEDGHELMYISSRETETEGATYHWLLNNGFIGAGRTSLVCVPGHASKAPYMRDCQYIIDDRPKTVVEFVYDHDWKHEHDVERKGFVKAYPYNQNLTDIPNLYLSPTWAGLSYYLKRKGILSQATPPALAV